MSPETLFLLFPAGIIAGCITALAGGSSLITFPALMAVGLPPVIANATNFATVLPGNLGALPAYMPELREHKRAAVNLLFCTLAGGLIGCFLLLHTSNAVFIKLVPWIFLTATAMLAFGKSINARITQYMATHSKDTLLPGYALIFLFSIYGGFFGAGLGMMMFAGLTIIGYTQFHEANALKNLLNAAIGILGVIIFSVNDLISWPHAVVLMAGTAIGGYSAIRLSRFIPQDLLSKVMIVIGFGLSAYYFWR